MGSMKISAGVDIGSTTSKATIIKEGKVIGSSLIPSGHDMAQSAETVFEQALKQRRLEKEDINYIIATGYGRHGVLFADETVSEIACHAKGAYTSESGISVIIDVGGQDSKLIWINETGSVMDFAMNDKCAAGTGRFLDLVSGTLGLGLKEMGKISLKSHNPCTISSTCAIFAETEVVALRSRGTSREDIVAGIHQSLALRIMSMGSRRGFKKEVAFSGGVAKNVGMCRAIEEKIGFKLVLPEEPQLMGALGAALLASERNRSK